MSWSSWPPISLRRPASSRIFAPGDVVALGGVAGVLEERGVDAGVAHHQRHPVERALLGHRRAYDVLGGIDDLQEVDAGLPAELVGDTDERLERRVAGTGAEPAHRPVDLGRTGTSGDHGVGDAEAEVLVTVEADRGLVPDLGDQSRHAIGDALHDQRAGGVDDVHALAAGVDHDARLLGQHLGRLGVAHHQEADGLQPELAGEAEVLPRRVGLGAVRRDAADLPAVVLGGADVVLGADAGEHEERDAGASSPSRRRA